MTDDMLNEAIAEARRFILKAKLLQDARKQELHRAMGHVTLCNHLEHFTGNSINLPLEQGAVRRASMDLTRSLAKLRNYKP